MSNYYIELSDSTADRLYLDKNRVDVLNYNNNRHYDVFALDVCDDDGNTEHTYYFASIDNLNDYCKFFAIEPTEDVWLYNQEGFTITWEEGGKTKELPCLVDIKIYKGRFIKL